MPLAVSRTVDSLPAAAAVVPRLRVSKLCVAVQGATPAELIAHAEAALKDSVFLEFRLDFLPKPAAALSDLNAFLNRRRDVTAIATCRRKSFGGHFTGSLNSELEILLKAARSRRPHRRSRSRIGRAGHPAPVGQVPSCPQRRRRRPPHQLARLHPYPPLEGLEQTAQRIAAFDPEFVKVVSTARSLADNLAILRMIENQSLNAHVVGIAMGEEGLISRVLGPRAGGAFTFASAADGAETAPGQVSARTLLDLYRIEQVDQATRIFGVAGNPIAHSLSPLMHVTAFRRENVNAIMLPLKVRTLDDLLTVVRDLPLDGVAVTMPLKQELLPHLANMDPLTARIGACNTLRTGADGKLYGFNTDVAGVVRPLEKRMKLKGARILVLGAGGAARAAVFGLVEQGSEVYIVNRTHEKAAALARKAKAHVLKQIRARQTALRRHHQHHALRHDRHQAGAAHQRKRAQRLARL